MKNVVDITGIFGSPLEISIKCFLDALLIFTSECRGDYHLREVNMVNNDDDGVITTIALLHSLLEVGQDQLMAEAIDKFTKLHEKRKGGNKNLSKTISAKGSVKDDFHSIEYGKRTVTPESSKRRSSSMSRASAKSKSKEDTSPRSLDLEGSRNKGSLKVTGKSSGSVTDRSSSERKSRADSAASGRSTTASRLANSGAASGAKNSPRGPPAMKQSLVTSPPGGGAKPKTKSSASSRNVPLKANTMLPPDTSREILSPRQDKLSEAALHQTSNPYENDMGLYSLPGNFSGNDLTEDRYVYCKICVNEVKDPKKLYKCGHTFCAECIDGYLRKHNNKCPTCGVQYNRPSSASDGPVSARDGPVKSTTPAGSMSHLNRRNLVVPGYEYCEGAIEIHYDIPSGKQGVGINM